MIKPTLSFLFHTINFYLGPEAFVLLLLSMALFFWKTKGRFFIFGAILFIVMTSTGMLPLLMVVPLQERLRFIDDEQIAQHHNLIVLGGGISAYPWQKSPGTSSYARVLEAYRIFYRAKQQGVDYTLFLSGYDADHQGTSEAAIFKKMLIALGVPEKAIVLEEKSRNTFENAKYLAPLLDSREKYLLVTGAIHMKRAQRYFERFNITTLAAPSDFYYPILGILPSFYNMAVYDLALHECGGLLMFWLYERLSLND